MGKRSAKTSHLQGVLEMPGFKGFPTGGNYASGFASEADMGNFEIPSAKIAEKFSNGRRAHGHLPLHNEDVRPRINALSKHFLQFGFGQSATASETKRASCPETAMIPNERPIPFYHDLADAQGAANSQLEIAHAAMYEGMGKRFPTIHELKSRHKVLFQEDGLARMSREMMPSEKHAEHLKTATGESMEKFFSDYNRVRLEQQMVDLVNKGYTEDEVAEYMREKRVADIKKDAMSAPSMAAAEAAIMAMRTMPTHTGAAGLTPQNANQLQSIQELSKTAKKSGVVEGSSLAAASEAYAMAGRMQQPEMRVEAVHEVQLAAEKEMKREAGYRRAVEEGRVGRGRGFKPMIQSKISDFLIPK